MLPTSRGFDSHFGYWLGCEDHIRHRVYGAYDFNDDLRIANEYNGTFSTPLFAERAIDIINSHKDQKDPDPFFMYLAFQDIHWPLQAPDEYVDMFRGKTDGDFKRMMVCAMAAHLDEAIGNVTAALKSAGLWDNTLVVFTSDNGGPTNGDEVTASNNFPLRGGKNTLWQGGVRVPAIITGPGITKSDYVNDGKMHATDWLPTLLYYASGKDWSEHLHPGDAPLVYGDGVNVWNMLSTGAPSPRDWILLESHPQDATEEERFHGDALIVGDWKLLRYVQSGNTKIQNGWFPPPGQDPTVTPYTVKCDPPPTSANTTDCQSEWCLYNIAMDPCEYYDVSKDHPDVMIDMLAHMREFQQTSVYDGVTSCMPAVMVLDNGARVWQPCDMVDGRS